jgi:hypothetical protein
MQSEINPPQIKWIKNDPDFVYFTAGSAFLVVKRLDDGSLPCVFELLIWEDHETPWIFEVLTAEKNTLGQVRLWNSQNEDVTHKWSQVEFFHVIYGKQPMSKIEGE